MLHELKCGKTPLTAPSAASWDSLAPMRVRIAVALALLAGVALPAAASAAEPIMKLTDVKPGMRCSALSVVQGTAPSEFQIEVIDVLSGEAETIGARILFRASGAAVEATGIGPGFSGSPIYCPGPGGVRQVAGAISEGIGQYGNKVALATPIEQVLGTPARAPQARSANALLRRAKPLASPLTVSGLSSGVRRALTRAARRADRPLLAAPAAPALPYAPYDPLPGTSIAAGNVTITPPGGEPGAPISLASAVANNSNFAGVIQTGWLGAVTTNIGTGMELQVIAAAVIGGANLAGGAGTAFGALVGAALIEVIRNSLGLLGINAFWQGTFIGAAIILAVLFDRLRNLRQPD